MDNHDFQIKRCYNCGGTIDSSESHGGFAKIKCKSCGYCEIVAIEDNRAEIHALNFFTDKVVSLLDDKNISMEKNKDKKIEMWRKHDAELNRVIENYGGKLESNAFLAICHAAHLTSGFVRYSNNKENVEHLYTVAKNHLSRLPKKGKRDSELFNLITRYERKLRNKSAIVATSIGSLIAVGLITATTVMFLHAPVAVEPNSGISIRIPNNAVSIFDKLNIEFDVILEDIDNGTVVRVPESKLLPYPYKRDPVENQKNHKKNTALMSE